MVPIFVKVQEDQDITKQSPVDSVKLRRGNAVGLQPAATRIHLNSLLRWRSATQRDSTKDRIRHRIHCARSLGCNPEKVWRRCERRGRRHRSGHHLNRACLPLRARSNRVGRTRCRTSRQQHGFARSRGIGRHFHFLRLREGFHQFRILRLAGLVRDVSHERQPQRDDEERDRDDPQRADERGTGCRLLIHVLTTPSVAESSALKSSRQTNAGRRPAVLLSVDALRG